MKRKTLHDVSKKLLAVALAFTMAVTGLYIIQPEAEEVKASEQIVADTTWFDTTSNKGIIDSAADLYGFAELSKTSGTFDKDSEVILGASIAVNTGDMSQVTEAPANTWSPICNFPGTFKSTEGKLYTISGLYGVADSSSTTGMALFSGTKDTTVIENIKIDKSYFETASAYGLSAISSRGTGSFKNIYVQATLKNTSGSTGGILGMTLGGTVTVENCWSACAITDGGQRTGGIVGNGNGQKVTIKHCLNTGEIKRQGSNVNSSYAFFGGIIGAANGTIVVEDCLNTAKLTSDRSSDMIGSIVGQTAGASFTGSKAYGLISNGNAVYGNNSNSANLSGCKNLDDSVLTGTSIDTTIVQLDFTAYWDMTETTPVLKLFNGNSENVPISANTRWFDTTTNSGVVDSAADLYGFAELSLVSGTFDQNTVITLGADILVNTGDMSEVTSAPMNTWSPICNFPGTFKSTEGKFYTISGLYGVADSSSTTGMALFSGTKDTTVIENIKIDKSYFETASAYGLSVISSRGTGSFKNIYVQAILKNTSGNTGGILGMTLGGTVTVENCCSACAITDGGQRTGGIVGNGNGQKVTIKHCLNTGEIKRQGSNVNSSYAFFGGIIGAANGTIVVEDCLNTAKLTSDRSSDMIGSIIGQTAGTSFTGSKTYGLTSNGNAVYGNNSNSANLSGCKNLEDSVISGINVDTTVVQLDFTTYWDVTEVTPVLQLFNNGSDNEMLGIKLQAKRNTNDTEDVTDDTIDLRVISSVDSLDYTNVGFDVWFGEAALNPTEDNVIRFTTTKVLERINATNTKVEYRYSPKVMNHVSEYFVTGTLMGISYSNWSSDFYIKAFCTSLDGTQKVYGAGRYFNVADATSENIINIPVEMHAAPKSNTNGEIAVTIADVCTTAEVAAYKDGYAHLNIRVPAEATLAPEGTTKTANKVNLASATEIEVVTVDGEIVTESGETVIYRNLESTYANNGADISWYSVCEDDTEFVIATDADLYGLATISGFTETVYVVADIDANNVKAVNWETGALNADYESYVIQPWTTIGNDTVENFKGTFDGQGHTISGVYCKQGDLDTGFFGVTNEKAKILNFNFSNSYIESATNTYGTGAVVGRGSGEIKNVYVDSTVMVKNTLQGTTRQLDGNSNGGVIGKAAGGKLVVENCWFAGTVNVTGQFSAGILGFTNGQEVEIRHCLNSGTIERTISGNANGGVGGLLGKADNKVTIEDCLNVGTVSSKLFETKYDEVGAIIGAAGTTANVTVTNTWWTLESCNDKTSANVIDGDGFGVNNAGTKDVSGCNKIAYSVLASAESTDTLDYTNYWLKVSGSYPILQTFK